MTFIQIIKCGFILPVAWIDAVLSKNNDLSINYLKVQKWSRFLLKYLGYELKIQGIENIPNTGPIYFVCNHQGTIDPALVSASCPLPVSFISKKENEKLPVLGRWAKNIQTIHFDRESRNGNVFMLREAARYLKNNKNLLIFPEGTRSKCDKLNEFKIGSLQPAYLGKATIIPVTLNNAYCLDVKNSSSIVSITYGKAISYEQYKNIPHQELTTILYDQINHNLLKNG